MTPVMLQRLQQARRRIVSIQVRNTVLTAMSLGSQLPEQAEKLHLIELSRA